MLVVEIQVEKATHDRDMSENHKLVGPQESHIRWRLRSHSRKRDLGGVSNCWKVHGEDLDSHGMWNHLRCVTVHNGGQKKADNKSLHSAINQLSIWWVVFTLTLLIIVSLSVRWVLILLAPRFPRVDISLDRVAQSVGFSSTEVIQDPFFALNYSICHHHTNFTSFLYVRLEEQHRYCKYHQLAFAWTFSCDG